VARIPVNADNFVRAESDLMFSALLREAGELGKWIHYRQIAGIDQQNIIRQNRDTLYSAAIVDVSNGIAIGVPDTGGRYISIMVVDQDHYVDRVIHDAGRHVFERGEIPTQYALFCVRILVDPDDPEDVRTVNALQDRLFLDAGRSEPFILLDYDQETQNSTRSALLELARGLDGFHRCFGNRDEVDPVRHLVGAAAGWGGLPEWEAYYLNIEPHLPVGEHTITVGEVPVDAFWSVSVYNADGFFEANERGVYNINSVTAQRNPEGTISINFGAGDADRPNYIPIMDGWNYMVRLYRPRQEILDGSWTFPELQRV
jgi:hypothetical protein